MADTIDKFATHDFARIFAEDIKNYLDKGGSLDNLSATNVYNVLDGKGEEDIFVFTKNTIKMVLELRTEGVRMSFPSKSNQTSGRWLCAWERCTSRNKASNRRRQRLRKMGRD